MLGSGGSEHFYRACRSIKKKTTINLLGFPRNIIFSNQDNNKKNPVKKKKSTFLRYLSHFLSYLGLLVVRQQLVSNNVKPVSFTENYVLHDQPHLIFLSRWLHTRMYRGDPLETKYLGPPTSLRLVIEIYRDLKIEENVESQSLSFMQSFLPGLLQRCSLFSFVIHNV